MTINEEMVRDDLITYLIITGKGKTLIDAIEQNMLYGDWLLGIIDDEVIVINLRTGEFMNWYKVTRIGRDLHTNIPNDVIDEVLNDLFRAIEDI